MIFLMYLLIAATAVFGALGLMGMLPRALVDLCAAPFRGGPNL